MYSARDGKNITVPSLEAALHTALHMSPLAAKSLTSALKPLLREDGTFDLVDTRKHNVSGDEVCDEKGLLHACQTGSVGTMYDSKQYPA